MIAAWQDRRQRQKWVKVGLGASMAVTAVTALRMKGSFKEAHVAAGVVAVVLSVVHANLYGPRRRKKEKPRRSEPRATPPSPIAKVAAV